MIISLNIEIYRKHLICPWHSRNRSFHFVRCLIQGKSTYLYPHLYFLRIYHGNRSGNMLSLSGKNTHALVQGNKEYYHPTCSSRIRRCKSNSFPHHEENDHRIGKGRHLQNVPYSGICLLCNYVPGTISS